MTKSDLGKRVQEWMDRQMDKLVGKRIRGRIMMKETVLLDKAQIKKIIHKGIK